MKLLTLLAALSLLSGCVQYTGTFTAHERLTLIHSTVFGNERTRTIPRGTYSTSFKFSSKNKIKLTFKSGGDDISVKIKLPAGTKLPEERGRFSIPANRSGQRNNVEGFVDTVRTEGDLVRRFEACSYTTYRHDCRVICSGGVLGCRQVCSNYPITFYGEREVEYRQLYTNRTLRLEVVEPSTGEVLGEYLGENNKVQRKYIYEGMCI